MIAFPLPLTSRTHIRLYMIYFNSTGVATALFSNYAATVSETMQEPWRSLSSLSTSFCQFEICVSLFKYFSRYKMRYVRVMMWLQLRRDSLSDLELDFELARGRKYCL